MLLGCVACEIGARCNIVVMVTRVLEQRLFLFVRAGWQYCDLAGEMAVNTRLCGMGYVVCGMGYVSVCVCV